MKNRKRAYHVTVPGMNYGALHAKVVKYFGETPLEEIKRQWDEMLKETQDINDGVNVYLEIFSDEEIDKIRNPAYNTILP